MQPSEAWPQNLWGFAVRTPPERIFFSRFEWLFCSRFTARFILLHCFRRNRVRSVNSDIKIVCGIWIGNWPCKHVRYRVARFITASRGKTPFRNPLRRRFWDCDVTCALRSGNSAVELRCNTSFKPPLERRGLSHFSAYQRQISVPVECHNRVINRALLFAFRYRDFWQPSGDPKSRLATPRLLDVKCGGRPRQLIYRTVSCVSGPLLGERGFGAGSVIGLERIRARLAHCNRMIIRGTSSSGGLLPERSLSWLNAPIIVTVCEKQVVPVPDKRTHSKPPISHRPPFPIKRKLLARRAALCSRAEFIEKFVRFTPLVGTIALQHPNRDVVTGLAVRVPLLAAANFWVRVVPRRRSRAAAGLFLVRGCAQSSVGAGETAGGITACVAAEFRAINANQNDTSRTHTGEGRN